MKNSGLAMLSFVTINYHSFILFLFVNLRVFFVDLRVIFFAGYTKLHEGFTKLHEEKKHYPFFTPLDIFQS